TSSRKLHGVGEPEPDRRQPDRRPESPDGEGDDEEVVSLADLARAEGEAVRRGLTKAVLEVEIEDEPHRQRREQGCDVGKADPVTLRMRPRPEDAQPQE